jgi:hypothetical protein
LQTKKYGGKFFVLKVCHSQPWKVQGGYKKIDSKLIFSVLFFQKLSFFFFKGREGFGIWIGWEFSGM